MKRGKSNSSRKNLKNIFNSFKRTNSYKQARKQVSQDIGNISISQIKGLEKIKDFNKNVNAAKGIIDKAKSYMRLDGIMNMIKNRVVNKIKDEIEESILKEFFDLLIDSGQSILSIVRPELASAINMAIDAGQEIGGEILEEIIDSVAEIIKGKKENEDEIREANRRNAIKEIEKRYESILNKEIEPVDKYSLGTISWEDQPIVSKSWSHSTHSFHYNNQSWNEGFPIHALIDATGRGLGKDGLPMGSLKDFCLLLCQYIFPELTYDVSEDKFYRLSDLQEKEEARQNMQREIDALII